MISKKSFKPAQSLITILFLIGMFSVASICSAFALALIYKFQPEITGILHRWRYFTWHYALPGGIISASLYVLKNHKQLFPPNSNKENSE